MATLDCIGCAKAGKCCDFQPFVPNYILGALLASGRELPAAHEHHYQPIGLVPARSFRERHAATPPQSRHADLWCAFFDEKSRLCTIYSLRPGECRHYLCEGMTRLNHEQSTEAFAFETQMAQTCLKWLGFSMERIHRQVDVLNLDGEPEAGLPAQWEEIYRACHAWASQVPVAGVNP